MSIHPTAVIDVEAELAGEVEIGPYVVIEGRVKIGRGTRVMAHGRMYGLDERAAVAHRPKPQVDAKDKAVFSHLAHRLNNHFPQRAEKLSWR